MMLGLCLTAGSQTKAPGKPGLAAAVDRTVKQGHDAILPPHISHLLGISPDEQEVPIKQFAEMGESIRGFDVSTAKHDDIVIFTEDRSTHETTFYLTSPRSVLRRVLSVRSGVGYDRAPTVADKKAFEKEKQYWVGRLSQAQ